MLNNYLFYFINKKININLEYLFYILFNNIYNIKKQNRKK